MWISDTHWLGSLGSQSCLTARRSGRARAETPYGIDAVMGRAVVDRHGEEPAGIRG